MNLNELENFDMMEHLSKALMSIQETLNKITINFDVEKLKDSMDQQLTIIKKISKDGYITPRCMDVDNQTKFFNCRYNKERKREFYAMSAEDAYSILEAIAEINNRKSKLKRIAPTKDEENDEQIANDVEEETKDRLTPFNFDMVNIKPGEKITFTNIASNNNGVECEVVNSKQIEYKGIKYSLSALAAKLSNSKYSVAGPRYFKYKGEWLNDLRKRLENANNE